MALFADPKNGLIVSCKGGAVRLTELQRAGGKKMAATDFLRGVRIPVGLAVNGRENG